jgi:FkbM family methyltransferase
VSGEVGALGARGAGERVLRRWIGQRNWQRVAGTVRWSTATAREIAAAALAAPLRALPDGVLISLRERLALRRPLDYPAARIGLAVTSRAEQELRLRSCRKEPETVAWIEATMGPGDVLYDVGANVGAYALIAALRMSGDSVVYAFEPGYRTFASLVENVLANGLEARVVPLPVALSDRTGIVGFEYATTEPGAASHPGLTGDEGRRRQWVVAWRLDDLVRALGLKPPTHLKIDVDGAELLVLQGAGALLAAPSLRSILVEVQHGQTDLASVRTLLTGYGWVLKRDVVHAGAIVHNWFLTRRR